MPFTLSPADGRHVEACLKEGVVDLVAHLKTVEADAWPYLCHQVGRVGAIGVSHAGNGLFCDTLHRTAPACMDGTGSMVLWVVE